MTMAREGRVGKANRQSWPHLLNRVIPASVWQAFRQDVGRGQRSDARWSAKYVVLCWILMGWSAQTRLMERFREGRDAVTRFFPRRRRPGRSYQGLVKAAPATGGRPLEQFWSCLRETIPQRVGTRWQWFGWAVMAVDGSRMETARTRANARQLKIAGRTKTYPQWWVTIISHLPTHVLWDWRQGPGVSDERGHLREMLGNLPASTLLVGDIGFCTFDLMWQLCLRGIDFLIRVGGHTTLLAEVGEDVIERVGQHQRVYVYPLRRRGFPPLRLRVMVLKRHGKRVYLLTNVADSTRLSRSMAGELYAARWGVEVDYRSIKQTLGRRKVLARTPQAGGLELAGTIVSLGLLILQAALVQGARVVQLSVSRALHLVRRSLEALRNAAPTHPFIGLLRHALRDTYARHHPKQARDWPHKKNEHPPRPPNWRKPTEREKNMIDWFWGRLCHNYG